MKPRQDEGLHIKHMKVFILILALYFGNNCFAQNSLIKDREHIAILNDFINTSKDFNVETNAFLKLILGKKGIVM